MKLRATDAAFWALLAGLVVGMAWTPITAFAQFKAPVNPTAIDGNTTVTGTLTSTGANSATAYTATSTSQFNCSGTAATCLLTSSTADATTSATVGAITLKAGANITAADLVLDVQDSAGAHAFTVTEAGTVTIPASQSLCLNGSTCSALVTNASGTNVSLSSSSVGVTLQGTGPYFYPSNNGATFLGLTINRWADVNSVAGNFTGAVTLSDIIGDASVRGTCTLNAGSPSTCTATVTAAALCTCSIVGGTAAIAAKGCAVGLSGTTLTITSANGAGEAVNYHCIL